MKKWKIIIVVGIVLISVGLITLYIYHNKKLKDQDTLEQTLNSTYIEEIKDAVVIKNGNIQNENLIEEFINTVSPEYSEEFTLKVYEYKNNTEYVEKSITYYPGKLGKASNKKLTIMIPDHNGTYEEFKEVYGYYIFNNGIKTEEYRADLWIFGRRIKEDKVEFIIDASPLVELSSESIIPVICGYSIKSSGYNKKFDLVYYQRRDLEVRKIYEDEIGIYTFGGDVDITIEGDTVYKLKDALEQKVITIDDIVRQAELDEKYGVCSCSGIYEDGGSIEYYYDNYTILKYNRILANKDVVIGFRGSIINNSDLKF